MYIEKWTKPMKHRRLHILKQFIERKVWSIRYVIYNILSKYNIIYKKHYYVDNVEVGHTNLGIVTRVYTNHYQVFLECSYNNTIHIREEHFYRKNKFGNKIVMTVEDAHFYTTDFYFRVDGDISINIKDDKGKDHWFTVREDSPVLRAFSYSNHIPDVSSCSKPLINADVKEKGV